MATHSVFNSGSKVLVAADQNLNKHTRFFGLTKPLNYLTLYAMLLATFPEDLHAMLRE